MIVDVVTGIALLGGVVIGWLLHDFKDDLKATRAIEAKAVMERELLSSEYGLDDRLREEAEDPTVMFIEDLDRTLNEIERKATQAQREVEWSRIKQEADIVTRRGQFNPVI